MARLFLSRRSACCCSLSCHACNCRVISLSVCRRGSTSDWFMSTTLIVLIGLRRLSRSACSASIRFGMSAVSGSSDSSAFCISSNAVATSSARLEMSVAENGCDTSASAVAGRDSKSAGGGVSWAPMGAARITQSPAMTMDWKT